MRTPPFRSRSPRRSLAAIPLILVLALALAGAPPAAAGKGAKTAGPPLDYRDVKGLSQPVYKTIREDVRVPMEDGVELYVEVVRPDAPGRFATILELSPYHGTVADRNGTRILPGPVDADGNHLGLTGYFAPRAYAVVIADLRGTGRSDGCLDHLGLADASDSYEIVEWAAKQKWSNGRVGMTGHSYVGSTPTLAAAQKPPHLVTIVPSAGLARMYDHKFQMGVPYFLQWAGPLFAYEMLAMDRYLPPGFTDPVGGPTGDNFGGNPRYIACGWTNSTAVTGDGYVRGHETQWDRDRDFTKGGTKADIPIFMVHGVNDNAARIAGIHWFNKRRDPQDKAWIGQWDHGSGRFPNSRTCTQQSAVKCANDQWTLALHAWFDKWLQQRDVDTGPPVEVFLNNSQVFTADLWPPAPGKTLKFYPQADGTIAGSAGASGTLQYTASPQSGNQYRITFESKPLKKDTLIIGVPKLHLVMTQTSPFLHVNATLYDVDGSSSDAIGRANWAIQPELREGIDNPQPVIPGLPMSMDLEAMTQAHIVEKGHSLRLVIASSHEDKVPTLSSGAVVMVHLGGDDPSHFKLPVIESPELYDDVCGGIDPPLKSALCSTDQ